MKKVLCTLFAILLVGCFGDDIAKPGDKQPKKIVADISGLVTRGFYIETSKVGVMLRFYSSFGEQDSMLKSVTAKETGEYEFRDVTLSDTLLEITSSPKSYIDPELGKEVYVMPLSVVTNMTRQHPVNVNYLTTFASGFIKHYLDFGRGYEEARLRAHETVLKMLHMPEQYTDFENYSIYGISEGDAMLAAISILVEKYIQETYSTTEWEPMDINLATGDFENPKILKNFFRRSSGLIRSGTMETLRREIEAKSPNGKVGNFEKYLNILFAEDGGPRCDNASQGKLIGVEAENRYRILACDDSTWRTTDENDFDAGTIFNPDIEYGTLVDPRDGRVYKTLEIGKNIWMAENLRYSDSVSSENLKGQTWCYDNDEKYCELFGRLYSWTAAMDIPSVYQDSLYRGARGSGICPEGWHLPDNADAYAFPYLEGGSIFSSFMTLGQNESGFSMIPGGAAFDVVDDSGNEMVYTGEKEFRDKGKRAYVWMSSIESRNNAWTMSFVLNGDYEFHSEEDRNLMARSFGAFVRCVKDKQ